jgi:hypothetical protein
MWVLLGMWVIGIILYPTWLLGGEKLLTILHTNDLHSHLLGFSPNIDYSPLKQLQIDYLVLPHNRCLAEFDCDA